MHETTRSINSADRPTLPVNCAQPLALPKIDFRIEEEAGRWGVAGPTSNSDGSKQQLRTSNSAAYNLCHI